MCWVSCDFFVSNNAFTHMTQTGLPPCKCESHSFMLNGHIDPTHLPISTKIQATAMNTLQIIGKYVPNNMPLKCHIYMPDMPITSCADMRLLCQYIYLILILCNQQCCQEYYYTYISHYWHMPLNKYAFHITHICMSHCTNITVSM